MANEIERLNTCAEKLGMAARYERAQMDAQLRDFVPFIEALTQRAVRRGRVERIEGREPLRKPRFRLQKKRSP